MDQEQRRRLPIIINRAIPKRTSENAIPPFKQSNIPLPNIQKVSSAAPLNRKPLSDIQNSTSHGEQTSQVPTHLKQKSVTIVHQRPSGIHSKLSLKPKAAQVLSGPNVVSGEQQRPVSNGGHNQTSVGKPPQSVTDLQQIKVNVPVVKQNLSNQVLLLKPSRLPVKVFPNGLTDVRSKTLSASQNPTSTGSGQQTISQSIHLKEKSVIIVHQRPSGIHSKFSLKPKVPVLSGPNLSGEQQRPVLNGGHNQTSVEEPPRGVDLQQSNVEVPAVKPNLTINQVVLPLKPSVPIEVPPIDLQSVLEESLPMSYHHKIISVIPMHVYNSEDVDQTMDQTEMLQAVLRLDVRNKEDALDWLEKYEMSSLTNWRVLRTYKEDSSRIIFKKDFRCQHNTQSQYRPETKKPHYKQTECKATISLTVKNFKMKRSQDSLLKTHPFVVNIDHCHNHPLNAADTLRHRRAMRYVKERFLEMFRNGHSPSSALRTFQYDLQVEQGDDFWKVLADGAYCPNEQWCYYQFYKQFGEAYGAPDGKEMVASLEKAVAQYNLNAGSLCAAIKQVGDDLVVALCTPLMKRVHEHLKSSAEMTFLDSGGMMDRQNTRIFTFLSSSVAGALPTGMILTSSESEKVITEGMALLKSILPSNAFFGRGDLGPQIGMTDDSTAERNSLRTAFPGIILLLCLFHILQAYWTYILDSKHKVASEHRLEIYLQFKLWCRCDSLEEFEKLYADQLAHPPISSNIHLKKHLKDLYDRAPEWALCHRRDLLTRGNNTDNLSEITIRNYKDVLDRLKAYSLVQLFDFFTTRIESYWERRIAAVVNNRKQNYWKSKFFIRPEKLLPLTCSESQQKGIYIVKNSENGHQYAVDMDIEVCTCPVGKNGAPCKHQAAVVKEFGLSSMQFMPLDDEEAKLTLHKIMTHLPAPPGWYASLKSGPAVSTSTTKALAGSDALDRSEDDHDHELDIDIENHTDAGSIAAMPRVFDEDDRQHAINSWQTINTCVMDGLQTKPEVFAGAVERMCQHFQRLKIMSENALLGAMYNFGKCDSMSQKSSRNGRYINVNNRSVGRRKNKQGGRRCAQQGKPAKSTFIAEHAYNAVKGRKRVHALPHDLSYRVQMTSAKRRKLF